MRAEESVRIVIDGGHVAIYGPGPDFSHSRFPEEMDAALHHAAVEDALVRNGWTLEELTNERRVADRRAVRRPGVNRRRAHLRLIQKD